MNDAVHRAFPRWRIAGALLLCLAVLAAAAVLFAPTDGGQDRRAMSCRAIVPALHLAQAPVEVSSAELEDDGQTVQITYRLKATGREGRLRWVRCTFEKHPVPDDFPVLHTVETDNGMLGEGRLFVLKRWWLEEPDFLHQISDRHGALDDRSGSSHKRIIS